MELLVVGAGAMGRWFAGSISRHRRVSVAFADTDRAAAETAADAMADARAVELGGTRTERVMDDSGDECFEVVCLAVPMPAVADAIVVHAHRAERAILDVTGVMAAPMAAMRQHAPDVERLSLHPLFGPENAPGRIAAVADAPGPSSTEIRDALAAAGNELFETTSEEHDTAMKTVQARAHTALLAFALAAEDVPDAYATPISAPLADLAAEVTRGSSGVYADIQATFEGAADVAAAAERIASADRADFERLYREAGASHDSVDTVGEP